MCGRMTLTRSGSEIAEYFALAMAESEVAEMDGGPLRARYNIAPSQWVPAILQDKAGAAILEWKTWGLVPSWSKDSAIGGRLFNARSETADVKPSFRSAWKRRRCLIAVDGFYEWTPRNRGHQPYHFRPLEGTLLALGGLFEQWQGEGGEVVDSCTVLTTEASADLEGVHHRMPVILERESFGAWLDPDSDPTLLKGLVASAPAGTLEREAVSRRVNSPRFDDAECLVPEASGPQSASVPSGSEEQAGSSIETTQGELFGMGKEESS